jgi:hypothetical protein
MNIDKTLRFLMTAAALLGLLAGVFVMTSTSELREYVISADGEGFEEVSQPSWFESQGWWGVLDILIFAAIFFGPYWFYTRNNLLMSAIFSTAVIFLTYLAGFSVGAYYIPAAIVVLMALVLLVIKLLPSSQLAK